MFFRYLDRNDVPNPNFFGGGKKLLRWRVDFSHLASFAIFHHGPRKKCRFVRKRNRSTVSIVFPNIAKFEKKGTSQRFILPFLPFSRSPFVPPPIHIYRRVKGIHFSSSRTGEKKNPLLSNWIIFHRFFGKFIYFPAKPDQNRTLSVYPSPIPHRHPRTTPPSSPTRLASTIFNTPTMI